jgi:YcxB-like protein
MSYQLTEDEYVHAQLGYWTRVRRPSQFLIQVLSAAFFLLLSVCVLGMPELGSKRVGWVLVALGTFLLVDRYWLARYMLRRMYRRSPNTSSMRRLAVTDEGMEMVMPNSSDTFKWAAFQKAHELNDEFLLMYSPTSFVILPKRLFDGAELSKFRSILKANELSR